MKTMNIKKALSVLLVMLALVVTMAAPAFADEPASSEPATTQSAQAEETTDASTTSAKAIGSAIAVGLAAAGGALGMGILGSKSSEAIARQPEAEGKIRTSMMLTLVFIETAIIYALLVVILIIFVL